MLDAEVEARVARGLTCSLAQRGARERRPPRPRGPRRARTVQPRRAQHKLAVVGHRSSHESGVCAPGERRAAARCEQAAHHVGDLGRRGGRTTPLARPWKRPVQSISVRRRQVGIGSTCASPTARERRAQRRRHRCIARSASDTSSSASGAAAASAASATTARRQEPPPEPPIAATAHHNRPSAIASSALMPPYGQQRRVCRLAQAEAADRERKRRRQRDQRVNYIATKPNGDVQPQRPGEQPLAHDLHEVDAQRQHRRGAEQRPVVEERQQLLLDQPAPALSGRQHPRDPGIENHPAVREGRCRPRRARARPAGRRADHERHSRDRGEHDESDQAVEEHGRERRRPARRRLAEVERAPRRIPACSARRDRRTCRSCSTRGHSAKVARKPMPRARLVQRSALTTGSAGRAAARPRSTPASRAGRRCRMVVKSKRVNSSPRSPMLTPQRSSVFQ